MQQNKKITTAAIIYDRLVSIFQKDEEEGTAPGLKLDEIDAEFFECAVMALNLFYENITGQHSDNIDFIGILNKIVVQGLLENDCKDA